MQPGAMRETSHFIPGSSGDLGPHPCPCPGVCVLPSERCLGRTLFQLFQESANIVLLVSLCHTYLQVPGVVLAQPSTLYSQKVIFLVKLAWFSHSPKLHLRIGFGRYSFFLEVSRAASWAGAAGCVSSLSWVVIGFLWCLGAFQDHGWMRFFANQTPDYKQGPGWPQIVPNLFKPSGKWVLY